MRSPEASLLSQSLVTRSERSPMHMTCKHDQPFLYDFGLGADEETRLDHQDITNVDSKGIAFTIRSVFIIDPKKTIRLILSYPASTGRNTAEVLRVVDSLQTGDKHRITTPIDWVPGDDVIVHPGVKNEEAKTLFPEFRIVKPYLRFTPLPKEKTSAAE